MDAHRRLTLLTSLLLLLVTGITFAQETQDSRLTLFTSVSGTVEPGDSQTWTFTAADGAMLTFAARTTLGDLDPILTITDSSGNTILSNDDYDYPETSDSLIEAMTIPDTATYNVTVSGFGTTSGDYELAMLPGFAGVAFQEAFDDESLWSTGSESVEAVFGNERMALVIENVNEPAVMIYDADTTVSDGYIHVDVPEISGGSGWRVGIVARVQADGSFYAYMLDDRGQWRFTLTSDGQEQVLRDWSTHPAIIPGTTAFSLGLVVNGSVFEFMYNGQLIGRLNDATLPDSGQIGLLAAKASTQGSETVVQFQNLAVTIPGETVVPEQIIAGDSTTTIPELQRRRLIPTTGDFGLIVPESFLTHNRPGVNALRLGGDLTFSTFALGATVTWQVSTPSMPAGCGLILRANDESDYLLAYLDQTGAAGLSQRQGDTFEPGIYRENITTGNRQRLLIVADDNRLLYYANGQLVGTLETEAEAGAVGNAVVNFEAVTTECQFDETWVWAWE